MLPIDSQPDTFEVICDPITRKVSLFCVNSKLPRHLIFHPDCQDGGLIFEVDNYTEYRLGWSELHCVLEVRISGQTDWQSCQPHVRMSLIREALLAWEELKTTLSSSSKEAILST